MKNKKALLHNTIGLTNASMAERVGFEPTVPLTGHLISSQAPSTTRTPLHAWATTDKASSALLLLRALACRTYQYCPHSRPRRA